MDYSDKDLDVFDNEKIKSNYDLINKIPDKSFNQLHLDEKWILVNHQMLKLYNQNPEYQYHLTQSKFGFDRELP